MSALPIDLHIPVEHVEIEEAYVAVNRVPEENGHPPFLAVYVHAAGEVVGFQVPEDGHSFSRLQRLGALAHAELVRGGGADEDDLPCADWPDDHTLDLDREARAEGH